MPNTVQAKFLLGWMSQHEALRALKSCYFDRHLSDRAASKLWRSYRDRVLALAPRNPINLPLLPMSAAETSAVLGHTQKIQMGPNARYFHEVIKAHPADLVARQYYVLTDHSENHGQGMCDEQSRIDKFLGVGLEYTGQLHTRHVSSTIVEIDLPHMEYVVIRTPTGFNFKERDRHAMAVRTPNGRLVLWGGYHRTHAVLCQVAGDAAAVAPLLTVMRGIPEVDVFFARASTLRDTVLGDRPALLRDFVDDELFITVNLRKKRAVGRIEQICPGQFRAGVINVNDDS